MQREEIQKMKDKAFQARSEKEWNDVMLAIKEAVAADENAASLMRNYCKTLLPKKREFWAKYPSKNQFQAKPKMMFSEDTDRAIGELARSITKYINSLANGEKRNSD